MCTNYITTNGKHTFGLTCRLLCHLPPALAAADAMTANTITQA